MNTTTENKDLQLFIIFILVVYKTQTFGQPILFYIYKFSDKFIQPTLFIYELLYFRVKMSWSDVDNKMEEIEVQVEDMQRDLADGSNGYDLELYQKMNFNNYKGLTRFIQKK